MKRANIGVLIIFFCLTLALPSQATVLIPKDFNDLTREADVVFVGTVIDIYSEWRDPEQTGIYTYVIFDDLEIIAGDYQDAEMTVRFSGGQVGDIKTEYAGVPRFNLGERNLLFLSGNFIELCPVVGWIQGNFRIMDDKTVGLQVIHTDDGKPIAAIQEGKIVLSRDDSMTQYGSPGVPDEPQAQVKAVTGPPTKMTLHAFSQAVRNQRQLQKAQGAVLGYQVPKAKTQAIPKDVMQPSAERSGEREKVIGYDMAPQPMQTSPPNSHEE